jgi:hypothetical protein
MGGHAIRQLNVLLELFSTRPREISDGGSFLGTAEDRTEGAENVEQSVVVRSVEARIGQLGEGDEETVVDSWNHVSLLIGTNLKGTER